MTEYYVRYPHGREKLEATDLFSAGKEAQGFLTKRRYAWVALDAITKETIFDTRETVHD